MGMGTGQAILDERDRLKMRVRELEEAQDVLWGEVERFRYFAPEGEG
jgi:hypothetical protein